MNKTLIIHAVSEAVILAFITGFLIKKINGVKKELEAFKLALSEQEQHNKTCEYHINQLYGLIRGGGRPSQGQGQQGGQDQPLQQPPPSFVDRQQQQIQQMQQIQQQQQQMQQQMQQRPPPTSMFDGIMNMLPSIMPLMNAGQDKASIAIRELSKKPATVEVMDDEEEDPDILEALSEDKEKEPLESPPQFETNIKQDEVKENTI
jgi:hypothetical protein